MIACAESKTSMSSSPRKRGSICDRALNPPEENGFPFARDCEGRMPERAFA
jgi:hypothetical protein